MTDLAAACTALARADPTVMPWLAPVRAVGRGVAVDVLAGRSVAQALTAAHRPLTLGTAPPMNFVAHAERPDDEAYETFIARTGAVPTRDNLHDLMNGLVWLSFPALKRRLNHLQAREIAELGIGRTRGPRRDALTLFDENAALLQAPYDLLDALRRHDWHAVFVERRAVWQQARLTLFGHALLEKLFAPRKAITAHVWCSTTDDALAGPPDLVLPVLGVPGWWAANEDRNFYSDAAVFRPARERRWPEPRA